MNNFNIQRFGKVFSRLMMINKREYIKGFLGFTLIFAAIFVLSCNPFRGEALTAAEYVDRLAGASTVYAIILGFIFVISGSLVINDLKNKQLKIGEFMLPATNLEKFVARLLSATVLTMFLALLAFFAGDLLQMVFNMLLHKGTYASVTGMAVDVIKEFKEVVLANEELYTSTIVFGAVMINTLGLYILGGMLFRKMAGLWTSVALVILSNIFGALFFGFAYVLDRYTDYVVVIEDSTYMKCLTWGFIAVTTIGSVYLAYRIFCKMQAVNTRWLNV